jgi:hypothetical protein
MSSVEHDARTLLIGRSIGIDQPQVLLADWRADAELLAEATAGAGGFVRAPLYATAMQRRRRFIAELNAAAELVPSIERACAIGGTP